MKTLHNKFKALMTKSNSNKRNPHKRPKSTKNYWKIFNKKIKLFNKDKLKSKRKKLTNYKLISKPNKIKSGNYKSNSNKLLKDLMILEIKKWLLKKFSTFNKKSKSINPDFSTKHLNSVRQVMIMRLLKCLKGKSFMSLKNKTKD